jgi:RimJ/RimL family protein N-acetyltransferase
MQAADLAMGAGGIMNWERACLGIPTIAFGIADNQEPILASLIHDGIVLGEASMPNPDSELMSSWFSVVVCNPELLRGLSARSSLLVDGRGAQRVAEVLIPALIRFRPATLKDSRNLFAWRNSADVSSASASGIVPDYFGHEVWLKETLANKNHMLLVIEEQQQPVGVVRFDCDGSEATISIYRIPGSRGSPGLVRQSTEWLRSNRRDLRRVIANILPGNDISLEAFKAAGYYEEKCTLFINL